MFSRKNLINTAKDIYSSIPPEMKRNAKKSMRDFCKATYKDARNQPVVKIIEGIAGLVKK